MNYAKKIVEYLMHPKKVIVKLAGMGYLPFISDETYLRMLFKVRVGYELHLDDPKTFSEKVQWLKLHDRKPEYTTMVDKYAAKAWIAERIGGEYIIPTLGVWDHFDDIDFNSLPDRFVLKCTHDSGSVVIVKDKARMDKVAAREKLERGLAKNWFYVAREWAYKDIPPRIIAEEYLAETSVGSNVNEESSADGLTEYKLFCFNGEPQVVLVGRGEAHSTSRTCDYFDINFNRLPFALSNPRSNLPEEKPVQFEEMLEIARKLSSGRTFLRVDTYIVNGHVYIGELTFYHGAGLERFDPVEWNLKLGKYIKLPISKGGA